MRDKAQEFTNDDATLALMIHWKILITLIFLAGCQKATERKTVRVSCTETRTLTPQALDELSEKNHPGRCPGFFAVLEDDKDFLNAQSVRKKVQANNCGETSALTPQASRPPLSRDQRRKIRDMKTLLDKDIMEGFVATMSRPVAKGGLWDSRFHNLPSANLVADWLEQEIADFGPSRVITRKVVHTNTPQNSLEAILPSTTPSDEYLVLGAHLDSTNREDKTHAPGANDNASGSAVLLETLRVLVKSDFKPKVNIVFHWYAAEEIGLVGSQEIARSYAEEKKKVLGMMNLDLAFYIPSNPRNIYIVSDYTDRGLNSRVDYLSEEMGYRPRFVRCGYACSDHASWTEYGFKSFFARDANSASGFRRIHTPRDILDDDLSAKYALRFAVLALAYIVDFGT